MQATEGRLLWSPSLDRVERAQLTKFTRWLDRERGLTFSDYEALWRWSVADLPAFWGALWEYFGVLSDVPPCRIVSDGGMVGAAWFEGSKTNYAEHLLRHEALAAPGEVALVHSSEIRPIETTGWAELGGNVRALAAQLRRMGIKPGDRVVSYMPNVPETAVAMIATVAIGAVWSAAAPEFGARTVIDRFKQIEPKLAFVADGYSFNGRQIDRREQIAQIAAALPSLEALVLLPYLGLGADLAVDLQVHAFDELLREPAIARKDFHFERVPPDHPLWILFSSGTTGLPKAIVHGHAGMIAEHLKADTLHFNLAPGQRMFFYTTTGWMMWNSVVSALISGATPVLYDGSPVHGGNDMLWRMAAETRATVVGASATLVQTMKATGVRPGALHDLSAIEMVALGGAPSTPETFAWLYENIKDDLWVTSPSGGTEVCTAMVLGVPTRPVFAGEIQCRGLGMDVHVWNDDGADVVDEIGELVVTSPMPSAPLRFWGDADGTRYRDSYYATFPGVWRHGDRAKLNGRGGMYVYGRSDSTLNRFGVRIGSAEIYRVVEQVPGVTDSLVVCCETPGGGFYMPLFVSLADGLILDDSLRAAIGSRLRQEASPRHVPDEIHQAPGVPYTLTGKKMEVPIRKLVMGRQAEEVASRDAMANPALLDWYAAFSALPDVAAQRRG